MLATLPMNRLGFDSPPAELPELPLSARERGRLWSDTVFQAVLALKKQLTHRDADIVAAAANSILELERTRMRHGKLLAGSEEVSEAQLEYEEEQRYESEMYEKRRAEKRAASESEAMPADGPDSNARALAEHAREAAEACEKIGKPLPMHPERFVARLLCMWGLEADGIPIGGFMAHLRTHAVDPDPTCQPARTC